MVIEDKPIPLFELFFDESEEQAVVETIRSRWISMGPKTAEFEKAFCDRLGIPHAIAVNNCTAALALALHTSGIKAGDEVIVPSLTFVATVNAVLQIGATPVFADIESLNDWTLSPTSILDVATEKTKAVIPMHYAGYMADMKKIRQIADEKKWLVIEDAAHAPQGHRDGIGPGILGDFACLSFFSNKNITTGEGGMVLCHKEDYAKRARLCRAHGITTSSYERSLGREFYDIEEWGWNFRMSDLNAALGLAQLKKLDQDLILRNTLVAHYRQRLNGTSIDVPFKEFNGQSAHYIFPVLLPKEVARANIREILTNAGIQTSQHYPAAHRFSHCRQFVRNGLPQTDDVVDRLLTLPLFANMSIQQVNRVCDQLLKALQ
jgi:dTDP-4-amino-4,6-dideoxygalactose transaminase